MKNAYFFPFHQFVYNKGLNQFSFKEEPESAAIAAIKTFSTLYIIGNTASVSFEHSHTETEEDRWLDEVDTYIFKSAAYYHNNTLRFKKGQFLLIARFYGTSGLWYRH